jgi:hypothetical protein
VRVRNTLAVGLACLTLLVGVWGVFWLISGREYYTYYNDSGRITYTVIAGTKSVLVSTFPVDSPEAREACAKEPPFLLVRPFRYVFGELLGESPCYHVAGR